MTYWKSLKYKDGKIISDYDKSEWKIGEWRTVCEPTELCKGLNCSEMILDAIGFVKPDVIAEVEIFGKCLKDTDKYTCERMRILRAWFTPPKLHDKMATTGGNLSPEEWIEFEHLSFAGMIEQYEKEMKQE